MTIERIAFTAAGQVQGVGFRPFVFTLAEEAGLTGFVRNGPDGVLMEVQGSREAISRFAHALETRLPPLARITSLVRNPLPVKPEETGFVITASAAGSGHNVLISPDTATCPDCLADTLDPANRRSRYAFTNCTHCGPRYTITRSIPYDRPFTSMGCFPLCPECRTEYENPRDRRFHAQPNACPVCGPDVWFVRAEDAACGFHPQSSAVSAAAPPTGDAALAALAELLLDGRIAAVKGLGGFHLACDACRDDAVAALRERKHRPHKPFAVMAAGLAEARRIARISDAEERLLLSPERPIVLCPLLPDAPLASGIAPDSRTIGIMLPYTPLHHVLFVHIAEQRQASTRIGRLPMPAVLVMTSGNPGGEPICLGNREALEHLSTMADGFLFHNRDILIRVDDSVVRPLPDGGTLFFRRARGYVPRPVALEGRGRTGEGARGEEAGRLHLPGPLRQGNDSPAPPNGVASECGACGGAGQTLGMPAASGPEGLRSKTDGNCGCRGIMPLPGELEGPAVPQKNISSAPLRQGNGSPASPDGVASECGAYGGAGQTLGMSAAFGPEGLRSKADENCGCRGIMLLPGEFEGPAAPQKNTPSQPAAPFCVLGVGAELKNTLCLTKGAQAFVSQHIGDMGNMETAAFHEEIREHLADVLQVEPELVVRDRHPDYLSSRMAEELAEARGLPVLLLQHHFAHAHAVLAENGFRGRALVWALDGTGLGDDGMLWGGELLLVDTENPGESGPAHKRVAHLAPLPLPGGEAAIREPWRIAHALLLQLGGTEGLGSADGPELALPWLPEHAKTAAMLPMMLERGINTPYSTSCGRLFDAASAVLGLCSVTSYEGQAAIRLEQAQGATADGGPLLADAGVRLYPCPVLPGADDAPLVLDTQTLFAALWADIRQGTAVPDAARRFHTSLCAALVRLAAETAKRENILHVGFSGGCMQNMTLAESLPALSKEYGLAPLMHKNLPPGDGCISFGQAAWGLLCACQNVE